MSSELLVAAIGVGMVALYQILEPGLDLGLGRGDLQAQFVERLARGVMNRSLPLVSFAGRVVPARPNIPNGSCVLLGPRDALA